MTNTLEDCLEWLDIAHIEVLAILMMITMQYFLSSVSLILGSIFCSRRLLIPWLVSHMVNIILMTTIFTCWTFIAFFIDLLMAIMFPLIAGLMLGLSIVMWKEVFCFSSLLRETEDHLHNMDKKEEDIRIWKFLK